MTLSDRPVVPDDDDDDDDDDDNNLKYVLGDPVNDIPRHVILFIAVYYLILMSGGSVETLHQNFLCILQRFCRPVFKWLCEYSVFVWFFSGFGYLVEMILTPYFAVAKWLCESAGGDFCAGFEILRLRYYSNVTICIN